MEITLPSLITIIVAVVSGFSVLIGVIWNMHNRKIEENHANIQTRVGLAEQRIDTNNTLIQEQMREDRQAVKDAIAGEAARSERTATALFKKIDQQTNSINKVVQGVESLRADIAERYVSRSECETKCS